MEKLSGSLLSLKGFTAASLLLEISAVFVSWRSKCSVLRTRGCSQTQMLLWCLASRRKDAQTYLAAVYRSTIVLPSAKYRDKYSEECCVVFQQDFCFQNRTQATVLARCAPTISFRYDCSTKIRGRSLYCRFRMCWVQDGIVWWKLSAVKVVTVLGSFSLPFRSSADDVLWLYGSQECDSQALNS